MSEWKEYKLGEVAEIVTGYPFPGERYEATGKLRVVRGENVTIGKLRWDTVKHWNYDVAGLEKFLLRPDDIVIGMDGSRVGSNRALIRESDLPLILAQRVACLRAKKGFSPKYLWYTIFADTFRKYVEAINTGTSIPHISQKQIADFEIMCPGEEEQKRIAGVLSSLDDKIDLLNRENATLEALAETLFRHYFIENPNPDWEEGRVSDFGKVICGKTPSKKVAEYYGGNIPFIKIPDMHGNTFVFRSDDSLSERGKNSQKDKTLPIDSIMVSCIATVGLVSMNAYESHTNQQINSVVPSKASYRYYLYCWFRSMYDELNTMASGGTATLNLNTGDFSRIEIPIPDCTVLESFDKQVKPLFEKIKNNQQQILSLSVQRDTLLPKLMSNVITI